MQPQVQISRGNRKHRGRLSRDNSQRPARAEQFDLADVIGIRDDRELERGCQADDRGSARRGKGGAQGSVLDHNVLRESFLGANMAAFAHDGS